MLACRIHAKEDLRIEPAEMPSPGPGEVLMQVLAVTTCPQWDLHLRHNEPMFIGHQFRYPYTPGQPGHEAAGVIAAIGAGVTAVAPGDRVSAWRDPGHQTPGCYAQYVVHRAENVIKTPTQAPIEALAPLELAMCVGTVFRMLAEMNALRGRVFGAITAGAWVAMPLGMLLGGILTENLGTFIMMIGLAITYLITTLSMAFIPAMKEMNRKELVGGK